MTARTPAHVRGRLRALARWAGSGLAATALIAAGAAAGFTGIAPASAAPPHAASAALARTAQPDGDVDDFVFTEHHAEYSLSRGPDGAARLTTEERLVARFPDRDQNRGIVRAIPLDYDGVELGTTLTSVTDEAGHPVPTETWEENGSLMVATGDDRFLRGEQTFVLRYEQRNTVRAFADTRAEEFYWDTNGVAWAQAFERASAEIRLTPELSERLTGEAACYRGGQGDTEQCRIAPDPADPARFLADSDGALAPEETMTVALGFTPGTFVIPEAPGTAWWATWLPGALAALAAGGLAWSAMVRSRVWGHEPGRGVVVAQYAPPAGLSLAEAGALIERQQAALPATIVDLAVRGAVRIQDLGTKPAKPKFALQFVSADGLSGLERDTVRALYGEDPAPGQTLPLHTADAKRAKRVDSLAEPLAARLADRGLTRAAPGSFPAWLRFLPVVLGLLSVLGGIVILVAGAGSWVGVVAVLLGLVVLCTGAILAVRPVRRTRAGAELHEEIEGIKRYVELAEADRFAMLQSVAGAERIDVADTRQMVRLTERLLPYAVLWGIERGWAEELGRAYETAELRPLWYPSSQPITGAAFAASLGTFGTQANTAVSAPGTGASGGSFSGGSSGGGFAGGGGGGGGGGGR